MLSKNESRFRLKSFDSKLWNLDDFLGLVSTIDFSRQLPVIASIALKIGFYLNMILFVA